MGRLPEIKSQYLLRKKVEKLKVGKFSLSRLNFSWFFVTFFLLMGGGGSRRRWPGKETYVDRSEDCDRAIRREIIYCKRAILCLSSSKILTPQPPSPSPPGECVLPPNKGGGTHSPGGEGDGGSIFWKTREIGLPSYSNNLSTGRYQQILSSLYVRLGFSTYSNVTQMIREAIILLYRNARMLKKY